jgi:hypothetical protein
MGETTIRIFGKGASVLHKSILSFLAFSFLSSFPVSVAADVTYEEQTKMGGIMQMMGMGKPMKSTTRVSGDFMRTDSENEATITDLAGEKVITLDTKKKTYSVLTFAEMRQKMEQAMASAQGKKAESRESKDVSMKTNVRVTDTGRSETIQGVGCKQYLLEMDLTVENQKEQQSGTMSTLTEMWMAKDVPGSAEVNAFYRRMAEKAGTTGLAKQWMAGGGAQGPMQGMGADVQKMADEMKKMEGHAMRTVMYFGDPGAAKKEAMGEKPPETEGGGGLAEMLKKMQQNPQAQGGGASGEGSGVMMKMTTETIKISTDAIDPKVFAVPSDYKLVTGR